MQSPPVVPTTTFSCSQCGGELHPDEGQLFLTCPYCSATVYLDKSRVVFHWYVAPTLDERQAVAALYRWMSGSQTVKDLDKKAQLEGQSFQYFPLWYFRRRSGQREEVTLFPAAATSVSELAHLSLPAGDLRKYDSALDAQAVPPTVPLEAALSWGEGAARLEAAQAHRQTGVAAIGTVGPAAPRPNGGGEVLETSLVHVPVYFFRYAFRGQSYTAVVDAASGTVLANIFPAKEEAPYRLVGGVTALVYLCLALFPLVGLFSGEESGLGIGLVLCSGIGLLAAPALFAWAFWVASKV